MKLTRPWTNILAGLFLPLAIAVSAPGQTKLVDAQGVAPAEVAATRPPRPADLPGSFSDVWRNLTFDRPGIQSRPAVPRRSLARDIAGDFGRFFTSQDTYRLLAIGLTGSLVARGFDDRLVASPFNSDRDGGGSEVVDAFLEPGAVLGGAQMQAGLAIASYGLGKWLNNPELAGLGRDLIRVQILTQAVTHAIKHTVRRTRPDLSNRSSFPSGHTSSAFATATVLRSRYGWKVGAPAYGLAAYIAASRVSENRHFLSDTIVAAAIGLAAGRTVRFGMGVTRFELSPLIAPGGGGVSVAISR